MAVMGIFAVIPLIWKFFSLARQAKRYIEQQRPDAVVLVHCHMGVNRGPSMAYAILLALGWDAVEALNAISAARPIAGVIYAGNALSWWHRTNGSSQLTFEREVAPHGVSRRGFVIGGFAAVGAVLRRRRSLAA